MFDEKLLDLLVCPQSHQPLKYDRENNELICEESQRAYPIRDGIPVLLIEESRTLTP
jgi:uncharacterized protein